MDKSEFTLVKVGFQRHRRPRPRVLISETEQPTPGLFILFLDNVALTAYFDGRR